MPQTTTTIHDDAGDWRGQEWEDETEWDDDRDTDDECDHEHATVDILTGEFWCLCGYRRYLSRDELEREAQLQAEMMEAYARECERDG